MKPILNQIIFKPLPSDELTEGGLFVPENCREINNKGTIVNVGEGTKNKPMRLKEGITVHRVKDWGLGFTINNELYFLMDESAIIAIE
ncbi:MAG: co-chaperone GroES family protein [Bacteroidota bacterium]